MERYSRNDVYVQVKRLGEALGHDMYASSLPYSEQVGSWQLDYNSAYGGYVIYEVMNAGGGVTEPLGGRRRKAGEMMDALRFALYALELAKVTR